MGGSKRIELETGLGDSQTAHVKPLPRPLKRDALIGLLSRSGGASIHEIVEALGWLPHTARAALTGLRKRGLQIERVAVADKGPARHGIRGNQQGQHCRQESEANSTIALAPKSKPAPKTKSTPKPKSSPKTQRAA